MKGKPPVIRELDAREYTAISGQLRKILPAHAVIDVERAGRRDGKKIVKLRCKYPRVAKAAIAKALGEKIEAKEESPALARAEPPKPKRELWERSMEIFSGSNVRDASELRKSMDNKAREIQEQGDEYSKKFQSDTNEYRKRMQSSRGMLASNLPGEINSLAEDFQKDVDEYKKRIHGSQGKLAAGEGANAVFRKGIEKYKERLQGKARKGYPGIAEEVVSKHG